MTSFADAESGNYKAHFRPDVMPPDLMFILRAFGTAERTDVTSTITFGDAGSTYGDVRAGDDIKICHVPVRNYSQASDFGSATIEVCDTRDPSTLAYAPGASTATVNFVVFMDEGASLTDLDTGLPYTTPVEDDDGIGSDVHADLPAHQRRHHRDRARSATCCAGHIQSTAGDVTLYSPTRILDADRQPTIDVDGPRTSR